VANASITKSLVTARGYFLQTIAGLSEDQLITVPEGASNNILWNIGHIVHSNSSMVYGPCGLELPTPASYVDLFAAGTSPADWTSTPPIDELLEHFKRMNKDIIAKYTGGAFNNFKAYELVPGLTLDNIEDTLGFCCIHEGVHIGVVMALKNR